MASEIKLAQRRVWMQLADRLQQEHIVLKNQLAEAVRTTSDRLVLEKMEYFQNNFINEDAIFALLRHDITVNKDVEGLQEDIRKMAVAFSRLKTEFHEYLYASGLEVLS